MKDFISIRGARVNNLKNVDLDIPRNQLVVFTGLSGSGKSSLAFDTLYAEGQRRYVESLSSYARQFLGQMDKPEVDSIEGLSPAISIDQKTTSRNPRSTVGTVTEIHDYLRLLYARAGVPHCPKCGKKIEQQSIDQMTEQVMGLPEGTRIQIMAPLVRGRKGEFTKMLEEMHKSGYVRVRADGVMYELGEDIPLDKKKKHNIEIVVDRLIVRPDIHSRLSDSLENALRLAGGLALVDAPEPMLFSEHYSCIDCGISIEELEPRLFSFNSPFGACPACTGIGTISRISPDRVLPDPSLSLNQGAIRVSGWYTASEDSINRMYFKTLAKHYQFSSDTPFQDLSEKVQNVILYGTEEELTFTFDNGRNSRSFTQRYEGVIPSLERRYRETQSEGVKRELEGFMLELPCPECKGMRLKPEALAVTVGDMNVATLSHLSVLNARAFLQGLHLGAKESAIAAPILKEVDARLGFLANVGLGYLTLARAAGSLSGGEAQRIRLATQIGSALMGVLYILDEPSIGLHQRDNAKLLKTLHNLRDLGNTLVVVEHDEETMLEADYIVDIGPGAGEHGGKVIAAGTPAEVMKNPASITGAYLSGKKKIPVPQKRRPPEEGKWLTVIGAAENNLKNITASFPLGLLTCVTGVSGSGKSTLINQILQKNLARELNGSRQPAGKCKKIEGIELLDKVIVIDQSPIGRTPRSNPATYTGVFDPIRALFAQTQEARARGYTNGRFSFNVKGGRCEACAGDGMLRIEMHFMPDLFVPCEVCKGKRYNRETLEVKYKGKNIYEVLEMTVEEALPFFESIPAIRAKMQTLFDVGLGYIRLGQPSTTLSGGEAQRVKLATELSRRDTGQTIYILDEPTTGLHTADVAKLIKILKRLIENGNTAIVIEHNLDVIKSADYCIDLGPEGGDGGGRIVAAGTPEEIALVSESHTGQYLKKVLPAPNSTANDEAGVKKVKRKTAAKK